MTTYTTDSSSSVTTANDFIRPIPSMESTEPLNILTDTNATGAQSSYINDFAVWTNDDLASHCLNCNGRFTFLNRKHHCRCCGGIFCGNCSEYFLWYNEDKVKIVEYSSRIKNGVTESYNEYYRPLRTDDPPYRTCVACYRDLRRNKLLLTYQEYCNNGFLSKNVTKPVKKSKKKKTGNRKENITLEEEEIDGNESLSSSTITDITTNVTSSEETEIADHNVAASSLQQPSKQNKKHKRTIRRSSIRDNSTINEGSTCPICNASLWKNTDLESEAHINECLQKAENTYQHISSNENPESSYHNRMLVYNVKARTKSGTSTRLQKVQLPKIGDLTIDAIDGEASEGPVQEDRPLNDVTLDTVLESADQQAPVAQKEDLEQGINTEHSTEDTELSDQAISQVKVTTEKSVPEEEEQEDEEEYPECPICFEEMLPGEKVGRLECLCVYHYSCIKDWFAKKRSKNGDTSKNWCPIHDALSS